VLGFNLCCLREIINWINTKDLELELELRRQDTIQEKGNLKFFKYIVGVMIP